MTISIHAPRVGGDGRSVTVIDLAKAFQSTPPVWGATALHLFPETHSVDFNPRPPCGGRHLLFRKFFFYAVISIHAPRVGGDWTAASAPTRRSHFNPRPPCGGRPMICSALVRSKGFQSTPPVWGATSSLIVPQLSIVVFQSTPPVWGATAPHGCHRSPRSISIHAPRVGGATYQGQAYDFVAFDISIHAPRVGGDPSLSYTWRGSWTFQSTPPVWGATPICPSSICNISIHFNPRPPCGGRRAGAECGGTPAGISIHAPRVGGDPVLFISLEMDTISIHAPRVGGDGLQPVRDPRLP